MSDDWIKGMADKVGYQERQLPPEAKGWKPGPDTKMLKVAIRIAPGEEYTSTTDEEMSVVLSASPSGTHWAERVWVEETGDDEVYILRNLPMHPGYNWGDRVRVERDRYGDLFIREKHEVH